MSRIQMIIYVLLDFFSDRTIQLSGIVWGLSVMDFLNIILKLLGVLPGAIYICFKIYHEFLKKKPMD